jgi:putative two-component system response regulator
MLPEILIADDDDDIRLAFSLAFSRRGWVCHEAATAAEALAMIRRRPDIGIVFTDIHMPGESGLQCMERVRADDEERNLEFVVITGNAGVSEAVSALRLGARDFLMKPIKIEDVWRTLDTCLKRFRAREENRELRKRIVSEIGSKNSRILALVHEIDTARLESLETLAIAAEHRDNETGAHIRRIGAYAQVLAKALGWPPARVECLGRAAQLHDIGKVGVPDSVLQKKGPLTPQEWVVMKKHAEIGSRILGASRSEAMQVAAQIALSHHERWDGTGYPQGLAGEAIPIEARIVAVCDVYDALRSARPYKPAIDHRTTMKILLEGDERTHPRQFDPAILDLFAKNEHTLAALHDHHSDADGDAGEPGRVVAAA